MSQLDWVVLAGALGLMVTYGVWRGGRSRDIRGFLLAGKEMHWGTVALSIMATQASAITFLSTPGQAYTDGMRFVQFYFGLPIAMVVLSITAVPLYYRLKVYTAYEFLEGRFDLKTRALTAFLFLIQRGLAAGLTIFAPALILSVILGWDMRVTILVIGGLVVIYTTSGGTRAVSKTQVVQATIILVGMVAAFVVLVGSLPADVSFLDALRVAGKAGRLNAIDTSFSLTNRYTLWSGLIGGAFLQLSYFGTDQSQVQRYLTGKSVAQSRLGLLFNGMAKVPMQFGILLLGATVFAFYQFAAPPIFFNPVQTENARSSADGGRFAALEQCYRDVVGVREQHARELVRAMKTGDPRAQAEAQRAFGAASAEAEAVRKEAIALMRANDRRADPSDTNYVFLSFVVRYLPAGLVGLVLAAVFAASMSASSAELNALASATVVDVYRRLLKPGAEERHYVVVSRLATVFWGAFAIAFAQQASRLGSLVEAVNILGSLFYGTILGIFLTGFYVHRVSGTSVFAAAIVAETAVIGCYLFTPISFLWYNVLGCLAVILIALVLEPWVGSTAARQEPSPA
ncbi:MAG: sodium:solute symporter [Acidobacteria bacterium RBG_13_68_16]|nr:MAG: sodium:solute symporter [Acidobacteria bacterium RBG_13_68_16]